MILFVISDTFIDFSMNRIRILQYWPMFHLRSTVTCLLEAELGNTFEIKKKVKISVETVCSATNTSSCVSEEVLQIEANFLKMLCRK